MKKQCVRMLRTTNAFNMLVLPLLLVAALASEASGHHILGIPHYAYDERYPQVPILTYRVDAGDHEVEMTGYPGKPKPGEQCFLNLYIRDPETGEPFDGTVQLTVMRDRILGKDPIVYGPAAANLEEAVYKFFPRFEAESNYTIRVSWEVQGVPWIIDLPMVVGEPGSPWSVLAGVVAGVALFLIVIRALRIKRQRRSRRQGESSLPRHSPVRRMPRPVEKGASV